LAGNETRIDPEICFRNPLFLLGQATRERFSAARIKLTPECDSYHTLLGHARARIDPY